MRPHLAQRPEIILSRRTKQLVAGGPLKILKLFKLSIVKRAKEDLIPQTDRLGFAVVLLIQTTLPVEEPGLQAHLELWVTFLRVGTREPMSERQSWETKAAQPASQPSAPSTTLGMAGATSWTGSRAPLGQGQSTWAFAPANDTGAV